MRMQDKKKMSKLITPDFTLSPKVDKVGVEERVARFQTRSIKSDSKMQALKMALSMIDLTTLEIRFAKCVIKQCIYMMFIKDYLP